MAGLLHVNRLSSSCRRRSAKYTGTASWSTCRRLRPAIRRQERGPRQRRCAWKPAAVRTYSSAAPCFQPPRSVVLGHSIVMHHLRGWQLQSNLFSGCAFCRHSAASYREACQAATRQPKGAGGRSGGASRQGARPTRLRKPVPAPGPRPRHGEAQQQA